MNPIIVCGLGQVGYRVTLLLQSLGESVVVITDDARSEWRREVEEKGVKVVMGDIRDEKVVLEAGLRDAKALIACTSNDLTNIEVSLDAKRYCPDLPIVARMFDQNLAVQLQENLGVRRALAMSVVAAPAFASAAYGDHVATEFAIEGRQLVVFRLEVLAGGEFDGCPLGRLVGDQGVAALLHVSADGVHTLDPADDIVLKPGDVVKLLGASDVIRKQGLAPERPTPRKTDAVLKRSFNPFAFVKFFVNLWRNASVEIRAVLISIFLLVFVSVFIFGYGMGLSIGDAFYFVITTVTTTGYGDISPKDANVWLKLYACLMMILGSAFVAVMYSLVTDYIVTARLQQLVGRQKVPDSGHVIVAGIGDVGYRIVEELDRMGAKVVAIDADGSSKYVGTIRNRVPLIFGDARDPETLRRAGGERSIATIAATGDDAVNLSIGLASEAINPESRSVLRLFDGNFANKVQALLNIDAAMSASRIAAPFFASAALEADSICAFVLRNHLFSIVLGGAATGGDSWSLQVHSNGKVSKEGSGQAIRVVVRTLA